MIKIKHHISKYVAGGKRFAVSWIQVSLFGRPICFSIKRAAI